MVLTRSQRMALDREERHKNGIFTDDEEDEFPTMAAGNGGGDSGGDDAGGSSDDGSGDEGRRRRRSGGMGGLNDTPRGKGCRVVRHQLTFEEEQQLEIAQRKAKAAERRHQQWLKEKNIPPKAKRGCVDGGSDAENNANDGGDGGAYTGITYGSKRPEREAARKAMEKFYGGGSSSSEEDELLKMPGKKGRGGANPNTTMVTYRKSGGGMSGVNSDDDDDLLLRCDSPSRGGDTMLGGRSAQHSLASAKRMTINQQLNKFMAADGGNNNSSSNAANRRSSTYYGGGGGEFHEGAGGGGGGGNDSDRENAKHKLADVQPIEVDMSTTFAQVGGLPSHILTLRETVLIPLLYPKLLSQLKIRPPRGVLFVGPPGTGKTLMARALAAEGSRVAGTGQKVSFFLRKGADMLSKWMGESEKQLRMLFDEARKHQPSIIFFDEIDGLAPIRHGKQDQSYAALVSTLLALMDGLTDRGQVVVIGATNRPDTLDPALRRPGRFDRELRFPMPDASGRRQIIDIHMKGQAVSGGAEGKATIREDLVKRTSGWSGADLQSLCTAASLHALRRSVPQIYVAQQRLKVPTSMVKVKKEDYDASLKTLNSSVQRISSGSVASVYIPQHVERLLDDEIHRAVGSLGEVWAPAAAALERSETEARALKGADHTRQLVFALTTQLIPCLATSPHAAVMVLLADPVTSPSEEDRLFITNHVAKGVVNRLPSMYGRTVHMPNIGRGSGAASSAAGGPSASSENPADQNLFAMPSDDAPSSITELFAMMRACTPGLLLLLGFEEWSNTASDADVSAFKYNLATIGQLDIAVMVPLGYAPVSPAEEASVARYLPSSSSSPSAAATTTIADDSEPCDADNAILKRLAVKAIVNDVFMLPSLGSTAAKLQGPSVASKEALLEDIHAMYVQAHDAVAKQVEALGHLCAGCDQQPQQHNSLSPSAGTSPNAAAADHHSASTASAPPPAPPAIVMPWPELPVDDAPVEQKRRRLTNDDKRRAYEEWERIEYKRRQLRYVLHKWVSGYMASKKYQFFLSADLDFTPDHELWPAWQKHVRGKKIGLQDIAAKLENDEYTCLSAYNEDVERLCANVRTFFGGHETRYRPKVVDLKETTLLNTYKLQRGLVTFCEDHKDATEPVFDDEDDASSSSDSEVEYEETDDEGEDDDAVSKAEDATPHRQVTAPKKRRRRRNCWGSETRKKKKAAPKRPREDCVEEGGEKENMSASNSAVSLKPQFLEDEEETDEAAPPVDNAVPAAAVIDAAVTTPTAPSPCAPLVVEVNVSPSKADSLVGGGTTNTSASKFVTPPPPRPSAASPDAGNNAELAATQPRPPVPTRLFGMPGSMLRSSVFAAKGPTTPSIPTPAAVVAEAAVATPIAVQPPTPSVAAAAESQPAPSSYAAPTAAVAVPISVSSTVPPALQSPPALPAPMARTQSTTTPLLPNTSSSAPNHLVPLAAALSPSAKARFMGLTALQLHRLYSTALAWAHTFKRLRMHQLFVAARTVGSANATNTIAASAPFSNLPKSPTQYDPISPPASAFVSAFPSRQVTVTSPPPPQPSAGTIAADVAADVAADTAAVAAAQVGDASFESLMTQWLDTLLLAVDGSAVPAKPKARPLLLL